MAGTIEETTDQEEDMRRQRLLNLYFHRETLCFSNGGRKIEMLTITTLDGANKKTHQSAIKGLFPFYTKKCDRPYSFGRKQKIIVTARITPGHTPSSYCMDAMIDCLTSGDESSTALLNQFVFILFPMLNPDGVVAGHYKLD